MLGSLQLKGPIYWLHVHPTELPSKASCGLWCRKRFQTSCVPAAYPGFQRLNHWRNPAPSSGTDRNWGNVCARKRFGNRAVRDLSRAKLIQELVTTFCKVQEGGDRVLLECCRHASVIGHQILSAPRHRTFPRVHFTQVQFQCHVCASTQATCADRVLFCEQGQGGILPRAKTTWPRN